MKLALRFACLWTCLAALPLTLAACQDEKAPPQRGNAEGEILPASVSDAMLPYDTVRSQPPLAPMPVATGKGSGKTQGNTPDETDSPGSAEAAQESPTPVPAPPAGASQPSSPAE
jgi:hypothetical protein